VNTIEANGVRLHVARIPPSPARPPEPADTETRAPTVVLIHGLIVDNMASWFFSAAPALASAGFDVLMYDLRGHGRSERPETGYRLETHIDDLEALLAGAGVTGEVYLVGNSFGGLIAFGFCLRRPDLVAGVAALESGPPTRAWLDAITRTGEQAISTLARANGAPLPAVLRDARRLVGTTSVLADVAASQAWPEAEWSGLDMPVLCIYGGDSGVSHLAADIPRVFPRSLVEVLPGHGHHLLPAAAREVEGRLLDWLTVDCGCVPVPAAALGDGS
jgi:pimeloyl-ACP methyl ester carboxylesterase